MADRKMMTGERSIVACSGYRLTKNDYAVIDSIAREGFQTYLELRQGALKSCHRANAWRRMKRLVRIGVLDESKADGCGTLGWSLSRRTLTKLRRSESSEWSGVRSGPSYRTSFRHDLTLRQIKKLLSQSPAITNWKPEHVLKSEAMSRLKYISSHRRYEQLFLVPDALFHVECRLGTFDAALELELTRKSRPRIYKKLEAYLTTNDFEYAFFILGSDALLDLFREVYQEVMDSSGKIKTTQDLNGIYFTTFENIQKRGLKAIFQGERDSVSFAELR